MYFYWFLLHFLTWHFIQKRGTICKLYKKTYLHKNPGPSNEYVIAKGSTYIADKDNPPHAQAIENVPHFCYPLAQVASLVQLFSNKLFVKSNVGTDDRSKLENRFDF